MVVTIVYIIIIYIYEETERYEIPKINIMQDLPANVNISQIILQLCDYNHISQSANVNIIQL